MRKNDRGTQRNARGTQRNARGTQRNAVAAAVAAQVSKVYWV